MRKWVGSDSGGLILVGATIAVSVYFAAAYAGPYKWLAEWQLSVFGRYFPAYTWAAEFLICVVALALLMRLVFGRPTPKAAPNPLDRWLERKKESEARERELQPTNSRSLDWLFVPGILGAIGLAMGVTDVIRAELAGDLTKMNAASVERGAELESGWVEVTNGRLLLDAAISFSDGEANASSDYYVPLVSDGWQPGDRVSMYVFVESESRFEKLVPEVAQRGVTTFATIPGAVRVAFEASPYVPADEYHVFDVSSNPDKLERRGYFCIKWGSILLGVFGPLFMIMRRRNRSTT